MRYFSFPDNAKNLVNKIKGGNTKLVDEKIKTNFFETNSKDLRKGRSKSQEQKETIANLNTYHNAREDIIQLFDDYTRTASETRYRALQGEEIIGTRIKILPPKSDGKITDTTCRNKSW